MTCADEVGGPERWCDHAQRAALCPAAADGVADRHGGRSRDCDPGAGAAGCISGDGVQSLDTKAREVGELLSESLSVVEDRFKVIDEDFKELLERRTAETASVVQEQMVQVERFTDSVHQSATVFRDSLSKLENRVHKVMVRVSALDELCEAFQKQSKRVTRQLVVEEMEKRSRDGCGGPVGNQSREDGAVGGAVCEPLGVGETYGGGGGRTSNEV